MANNRHGTTALMSVPIWMRFGKCQMASWSICSEVSARPIVTVRTNAAPTLWALVRSDPRASRTFRGRSRDPGACRTRVREDRDFLGRLRNTAQSAEPDYPPSPHLEEQIYGHPFPSQHDEDLMHQFHAAHGKDVRRSPDNSLTQGIADSHSVSSISSGLTCFRLSTEPLPTTLCARVLLHLPVPMFLGVQFQLLSEI